MFVCIDMDKLVFLHKHHDHDTISGLAFLEAPDRSTMIENSEREGWFNQLSQLDMQILYKNTTGFDMAYKWEDVQRSMMAKLVSRLDPTLALPEEVAAQVAAVEADLHNGIPYKYALGSRVPAKAQELFPLKAARPFTKTEVDEIERTTPPPLPPSPKPMAEPAPVATPKPKPGRAGGVRPVVRAAAEKAWAEAGNGTLKSWEEVRKQLIADLEAQSYHPTTIRIKLSEWAKEKQI